MVSGSVSTTFNKRSQTGYVERQNVQKMARDLGLLEGKAIEAGAFREIMDGYEDAKRRARELDRMHLRDGR